MTDVTVRSLVAEMSDLARSLPGLLLLAWAILVAAGTLADTVIVAADLTPLFTLVASIAQLVLTVVVMRRGLDAMGIEREGGAGVGGLLLISIPLNLAVGLGLVLLVLPGLYLAARWRIAVPRLLSSDDGVMQAIGFSYSRTGPHARSLMLASLLAASPIVGMVVPFAIAGDGAMPVPLALVANALLYAGIIAGWLLDLAAYRLIADPGGELVETFA